jgi:FMN phosphatase YigB (HAD superfamily)
VGLAASDLVMVGDNYIVDIQGANRCGIRAVWLRPRQEPLDGAGPTLKGGPGWQTIADLAELPGVLEDWSRRT